MSGQRRGQVGAERLWGSFHSFVPGLKGKTQSRHSLRHSAKLAVESLEDRCLLAADLAPFTPAGWSDDIVVSDLPGTNVDDANLIIGDFLHLDAAWANFGDDPVADPADDAGPFQVLLNHPNGNALVNSPGLLDLTGQSVQDIAVGFVSAGNNTFDVSLDFFNTVSEANEANNFNARTLNVALPAPNEFTPLTIPTGDILTTPAANWLAHADTIVANTTDLFSFTLAQDAGVFLDIDSRDIDIPLSNTLDTVLGLYDATGMLLDVNFDGFDYRGFDVPANSVLTANEAGFLDSSLYADLDAGTYYVAVSGATTAGNYQLRALADTGYLATTPTLSSNVGATNTLYLDFDGHVAAVGDDVWSIAAAYNATAFGLDADPTTFSPGERLAIQNLHAVTAEQFSPFDLNVTTVDPAVFGDGVTQRHVVTNSNASAIISGAPAGALGVANLFSFNNTQTPGAVDDNISFTFAAGFSTFGAGLNGRIMAASHEQGNTTSHEFGHALGLHHFNSATLPGAIMATPDLGLNVEDWITDVNVDGHVQDDTAIINLALASAVSADFDLNGSVDGLDFLTWQRNVSVSGGASFSQGDANLDGNVDAIDLAIWELQFGAPVIGFADFNLDGSVDGADFLVWQVGVGTTQGATLSDGDANYDGMVDALDLAVWESQFGYAGGPLTLMDLNADFDGDANISSSDFLILQENLGMSAATHADGDANYDGLVNGLDVLAYELVYNMANPSNSLTVSAVNAAKVLQPGQILVSTLDDVVNDDYSLGDLSLREALIIAAQTTADDTIIFADTGTITLDAALGELVVDTNVTVAGRGSDWTTIDAAGNSRVFNVAAGTTATISDLTITGGAGSSGGGIYSAGDLTLVDARVEGNSAASGAGIYQSGGSLGLIRTAVSDNVASSVAGGIQVTSATQLVLDSSTIARNSSMYIGGIYASNTDVNAFNSTISTNTANSGYGAAAYLYASQAKTATFTNVTVAGNQAVSGPGGGIYVSGSNVTTTLANSIVAGNTSSLGADDVSGTFAAASGSSLIGAIDGSTGLTDPTILAGTRAAPLDAGLMPLANYGGPTETYALEVDSLALNSGDNLAAASLAFDQRGVARVVGGNVDLGAVEYQTTLVSTLVDEDDGDYSNGDLSLREAISLAKVSADADVIEFAPGLVGTISLADSLYIDEGFLGDLTITGPGADQLTLDVNTIEDYLFALSGDATSTIGTLSISDLTLTGAEAAAVGTVGTGASMAVQLERVNILDNNGGGVSIVEGGDLTLVDSEISGNNGFAVRYHDSGDLQITGSALVENQGVGLDLHDTFDVALVNSTVAGNNSTLAAGGLILDFATIDIVNSTVTDNTGAITGGIYFSLAVADIRNTIVAGNFSAGVENDLARQTSLYLAFTGSAHSIVGVDNTGLFPTGSGNMVGVNHGSLRLSQLGNHGGPTRTHKLLPGSIAIDAGDDTLAVHPAGSPLLVDQRGYNRTINTVDVGAVEQELLGDFDGSGSVTGADFLLWQTTVGSTTDLRADGDGSGLVDSGDLDIYNDHFGNVPDGTPLSAEYGIVVVATTADEDDGDRRPDDVSLREALAETTAGSGDDKIVFRHDLAGDTITLGGSELTIDSNVEIVGPGSDALTIDANGQSRVFQIDGPAAATIRGLTLTGGNADYSEGGAIRVASSASLQLADSVLAGNVALVGGAISIEGAAGTASTIERSVITNNAATYGSGGVYWNGVAGSSLSIGSSVLALNDLYSAGGSSPNIYEGGSAQITSLGDNLVEDAATIFDGPNDLVDGSVTHVVTTFEDVIDGTDNAYRLSLREAVLAANSDPGAQTIFLPAGVHRLWITGTGGAEVGDLDVTYDLNVLGVGSNQTTVDATALAISQIFNNYLIADFDGSGAVNGSDFLTWQSNVGSGTTFAEGDADNDGDVDGDDLDLWEANSGGSDRYALAVDRVMEVY